MQEKNDKEKIDKEKIDIRKVDTTEYLDMVKGLIYEGKEVSLLITGNSMTPFLADERDYILISPIKETLKKGDMAFFQRKNGKYIMHRIQNVRKNKDTGKDVYYFIGDAQNIIEGPIERNQIFGVITSVCRKGKWIKKGSFWWEFFRCIWINMIPMRTPIRKAYSILIKIFK